jgi:hypothetical protein
MFFYQTKDRLSYEINTKTIQLFEFTNKKKNSNSIFLYFKH